MNHELQSTPGLLLAEMRATAPLVQCITNFVAMNVAANAMLAAGASPAMVHDMRESGEFAAIAGALTINIGTLSPDWLGGMRAAAEAANAAGRPWVLDPVAHFATDFRRRATLGLIDLKPAIIRGNASEILALGGAETRGQGADSGDPVEAAEATAIELARRTGAVVAVTGAIDFVTDGARAARVHGGSELMPRVTALGCALTCLTGAFAAVRPSQPFDTTVAALALFAAAGEAAHVGAEGPGSFGWRFLDALAAAQPAELDAPGRVVPRVTPADLRLYLVLDPELCEGFGLIETARAAVAGGVTMIQLRDKHGNTARRVAMGRALRAALLGTGVPLILNDDLDAALAIDADGLHIGQDDLAPRIARARLGPDKLLGLSVETEALAAAVDPALVNYAGAGPVFATGTKPGHKPAIGLDGLARLAAACPVPSVAIGGLKVAHAAPALAAGAAGIAVVSAICGQPDPGAAAHALAAALKVPAR